jgi:hypothetical protein
MGDQAKVSVQTKRAASELVWTARLDAGEMRRSEDKRHTAEIEFKPAGTAFGPQGTEITIENVDTSFWLEWSSESRRSEITNKLAEKYILYTTKSSARIQIPDPCSRRGRGRTGISYNRLPPINIELNGSPLSDESDISDILGAMNKDHVHSWSVEVLDPEDDSVVLSKVEVSSLPPVPYAHRLRAADLSPADAHGLLPVRRRGGIAQAQELREASLAVLAGALS